LTTLVVAERANDDLVLLLRKVAQMETNWDPIIRSVLNNTDSATQMVQLNRKALIIP
jgi:hypothetical protein